MITLILALAMLVQSMVYEDGSTVLGGCLPAQPCADDRDIVWTQTLQAWSDPTDYQEALYVTVPDGTCGVELSGLVLKLILCEI
jgi:hypothetical protein